MLVLIMSRMESSVPSVEKKALQSPPHQTPLEQGTLLAPLHGKKPNLPGSGSSVILEKKIRTYTMAREAK